MCAILDANFSHHVFGSRRTEAGKDFFKWINSGKGSLVAGGKLLEELTRTATIRTWWNEAQRAGRAVTYGAETVNERTELIRHAGAHRSDDPHILAVAQISGARLIYTNDGELKKDFKDRNLIHDPRGIVCPTDDRPPSRKRRARLLAKRDLCLIDQ